ncbi:MAG TPA: YaaL family protein [Pseudogracilibacillus sp.]|nr:YaaL family protein [Pseudogracilibacillus sp.]
MGRKKRQKEADEALLDAIFHVETEWKHLQHLVENSVEPMYETRDRMNLAEAKYMFLLKEAKHRDISLLRY